MKRYLLLIILSVCYLGVIIPFTNYLKKLPAVLKLGYLPEANVLKALPGDYHSLLAEYAVLKVLFYYGSLDAGSVIGSRPEYQNMYKTIEKAVKLDPYNMDAYYFSQATFTWQIGHAQDVNKMLNYGMKYRTWDYLLPFYAGFNSAYFLHDYKSAAVYMKRAAELSGSPLFTNLAARYFYQAQETNLGIVYLQGMIKEAKDPKIRKTFIQRRNALIAVKYLTDAVNRFHQIFGQFPSSLTELVSKKVIPTIPHDPYGGTFYLDRNGKVYTTSKFAASANSGAQRR